MSMLLMVKAMHIKVGNPLRKLVLIKLADNANDKGECFPSYQHIADQCEIGHSTVRRHIQELKKAGLLRIENRVGPKGNTSNMYYLTLDEYSEKPKSRVLAESTPPARSEHPPMLAASTRTSHSINQSIKDQKTLVSNELIPAKNDYPDEFEWIWKNKPEREGGNPKKQAYSACKARLKAGATWKELAEGLVRYSKYCAAKGITGTQMVQQMQTFFGTKESFKESWGVVNHAKSNNQPTELYGESTEGMSAARRQILEARAKRDGHTATSGSPLGFNDGTVFDQVDEGEWSDSKQIVDDSDSDAF